MATKRRRVKKRRRSNRKQRGGEAPKRKGEKFQLNKVFTVYYKDNASAQAQTSPETGTVAAGTEVTYTGDNGATSTTRGKFVMEVGAKQFIIAGEGDLVKVPAAGPEPEKPKPPSAPTPALSTDELVKAEAERRGKGDERVQKAKEDDQRPSTQKLRIETKKIESAAAAAAAADSPGYSTTPETPLDDPRRRAQTVGAPTGKQQHQRSHSGVGASAAAAPDRGPPPPAGSGFPVTKPQITQQPPNPSVANVQGVPVGDAVQELKTLKAQLGKKWTCKCEPNPATSSGGKKRRKTKRKKRSRKRRPHKKRRSKKRR